MNTTFVISGGAGRVATSIPALEKYHRLNPEDNFKVLVTGWQQIFWSHPLLQDRVFDYNTKGVFNNYIKNNNTVIPEPYTLHNFYNQKISLVEAFDEIINKTNDHSDLNNINLFTTSSEKITTRNIINQIKADNNNKKIVIIQPYGSQCTVVGDILADSSNRSLSFESYRTIIKSLQDRAVFINVSSSNLRTVDDPTINIDQWQPYFRVLISLIEQCDYFLGCDSVGQHIAKSFNKPGTVFMGGTNDINFTYPYHFNIIRKKETYPEYTPWRLSEADCEFADRKNNGIMNYTDDELYSAIDLISRDLQNV